MRTVVLFAFDGVQLLDVAGPADAFDAATRLVENRGTPYRLRVATLDGEPVRTGSGLTLGADLRLDDVRPPVNTLIVPGGLTTDRLLEDRAVLASVARVAALAGRVASVCSGAFILAEAGLLDGRAATTHWSACAELAARFPRVDVEPDRIFVRDGPIVTAAGVTAGIDMALALIEEDHGAAIARRVARWLVMFVQRPGGQSQFSERLMLPPVADPPLRRAIDAVVADPGADHQVPALARHAALSERHLSRLFATSLATTPARFVERVRVEAARERLEGSDVPVEAVARAAGFGSAETMRRAFLRVLGITPSEYRARFSRVIPTRQEEVA